MSLMRTTLTLEDDLATRLKELAHERGVPFKQVVNETIRDGLERVEATEAYELPTFDMGVPLMDLTKAAQLADALDDERRIRKMREGS